MMILLGLLLLSTSLGASDPAAEVAVQAVIESPWPDDENLDDRAVATAHLFGDREARLAIRVSASSRRRVDLRARLVQLGSGLAAPLGDAIEVAVHEEIGPAPRRFHLRLTPPRVKRVSELELQFTCRSSEADAWLPAGRLPLRIYPADLVQPLRSICESRSLLVLDSAGRLKEFLRAAEVPFVDHSSFMMGTAPSRTGPGVSAKSGPEHAVAIWVRAETQAEHRGSRRMLESLFRIADTVIVFGGFSNDYPRMKLIRAGNRTRLDVEVPLLSSLAADPRSQQVLVDAVLMSVSPEDPILLDPEGSHP